MATLHVGQTVQVKQEVFDEGWALLDKERLAFASNNYRAVITAHIEHAIVPERCWRVEAGGEYLYCTAEELDAVPADSQEAR